MVESFRLTLLNEIQTVVENFNTRWNYEGDKIALGSSDGNLQLYNLGLELIRNFNCQSGAEKMPLTSIKFRPESSDMLRKPALLATTCDGGVMHWNLYNNKCMNSTRLRNEEIYSSDFNLDGTMYVLGCKEGKLKIFDESTFSEVRVLSNTVNGEDAGAQRVFCLKWFDENLLMSAGWNDRITIWDLRSGFHCRQMFGPHVCGDSVDIRNDYIVSGSYHIKDQLQLWSLSDGRNIHTTNLNFAGKKCLPYTTQFCQPQGTVFAVGGTGSGEVYFYDASTMDKIFTLPDFTKTVYSIHRSFDNKLALATGNTLKIYSTI
jgi:COMPASS component SWD3